MMIRVDSTLRELVHNSRVSHFSPFLPSAHNLFASCHLHFTSSANHDIPPLYRRHRGSKRINEAAKPSRGFLSRTYTTPDSGQVALRGAFVISIFLFLARRSRCHRCHRVYIISTNEWWERALLTEDEQEWRHSEQKTSLLFILMDQPIPKQADHARLCSQKILPLFYLILYLLCVPYMTTISSLRY